MEAELPKAKEASANILRNQLDALRNRHYAQQSFEAEYQDTLGQNERAQRRHAEILKQYLEAKLQYQFAVKQTDTLKKMAPALLDHYARMSDLGTRCTEKDRQLKTTIQQLQSQAPPANSVAPQDAAARASKQRSERLSTLSEEGSFSAGSGYGRVPLDVRLITDKLFGAALDGTEGEYQAESDDDK